MKDFRNYLIIDGKSSYDFNMYISGGGTFSSPEKAYEEVEVPGKNGKLIFEEGEDGQTYKNVIVSYDSFIHPEFDLNFSKLKGYLLTRKGYFRLEDTYHPDEYRLASFQNAIEPDMHQTLKTGEFTLEFNCKPQRFLKIGEVDTTYVTTSVIFNKTDQIAKPLIRAYGTGTFTISNSSGTRSIRISSAPAGYTDIDTDLMDAYAGSTNCNGYITLVNSKFPVLYPGQNTISMSGISRVIITPRWWII